MIDDDRRLLDAVLDRLVPPAPARGIPGAGGAGVGDFISSCMAADASVAAHIEAVLARVRALAGKSPDVTPGVLLTVEGERPDAFGALLRATYMGYYSRPEGRAAVGIAPWPVHPRGYDVAREDAAQLDSLVAPVRARGRAYRDGTTPEGGDAS